MENFFKTKDEHNFSRYPFINLSLNELTLKRHVDSLQSAIFIIREIVSGRRMKTREICNKFKVTHYKYVVMEASKTKIKLILRFPCSETTNSKA